MRTEFLRNAIVVPILCVALTMPVFAEGSVEKIDLKSTAFENNGMIPSKCTCDGADISPSLAWGSIPPGAKSLVLISDDPDAPVGTWVHWVVYNIPPSRTGLPEGVKKAEQIPGGGTQGITDFGSVGYGGPCPPSGIHRYFFKLYALDVMLGLGSGASKQEVADAMLGHVIAEGELVGKYARR